jgi:sulfate adenylyltransferase subunit 1 (EFTu-like GTPase family)
MLKIEDEHLRELEDEAIFVMREVAALFEKKVILFSGGKYLIRNYSNETSCIVKSVNYKMDINNLSKNSIIHTAF